MKYIHRLLYGIIIIIWIILINILLTYLIVIEPLLILSENQVLYSMSTMAQVVSSLFGLILAAYAIVDPKLKEISAKDQQSLDYVDLLRKDYFQNIILLSITCAIAILSCMATIFLHVFLSNILFSILINQATLFGILSVGSTLFFGCSLLNPNALNRFSEEEKKKIEDKYSLSESEQDFMPFVLYYNKLETLITKYATDLLENDFVISNNLKNRNQKIHIFQSLDVLMMNGIINRETYEVIDNLRRYRNALVHSIDNQKVNGTLFEDLKGIYKYLNDVYENRGNNSAKDAAVKNLHDYGHKIVTHGSDSMLIEFISQHEGITIPEIAEKFSVSKSFISNHLKRLMEKGVVEQKSKGFKVTDDYKTKMCL